MLKKVLTALAIVILVFVLVGAVLSREYRVSRAIVVKAEPARIHALVADLKRWDEWTPWKKRDATIVTTIGTPSSGLGANQTWSGKDGTGWLKFTKSDVATGIEFDMALNNGGEDMPAQGSVHYAPAAEGTQVAWSMSGILDVPVIGGYMASMSDMMFGGMLESGLDKLKSRAEAP